MTLAEKILELRTAQGLSQGDLAERLEVSRQSVSKWETNQSVPDLDKIIKLADLFGVSVDELVRENAQPQAEAEQPQSEPQVIYVERQAERPPAQILGIILLALGSLGVVLGLLNYGIGLLVGIGLIVVALPLVLTKKHPWLICGWVITGLAYLVFNPYVTATPFNFPIAAGILLMGLRHPGLLGRSNLIGITIAIVRGLLTLLLLVLTVRAWRKRKR